jgi:acyl carrier protein
MSDMFDTESLSQPGVLERQLVHWLQRELSLTNLTWQTPLTELGIDSVRSLELVLDLSAALGHPLPATALVDHASVASLADLIRSELGIDTTQQGPSSAGAHAAEQIHALDERELAEVLRRRIDDVLRGGR